uniref:Transcription factor MYB98 n=1 Tax=Cajanus cajan TaxID=3821 RepID=A0A151TPJ2_CAJCA|nr:Transcription factor MYB98 [Cajanus cajan]
MNNQVQRRSITVKFQNQISNIIKGQWSADEDRVLVQLVKRFGLKKWSQIARLLNGRIGKQCRERWHNHLRPNIRKESWSEEEDKVLIEAHKELGNKWAEIARRMPGRSENTIKNHWNATKRRLYARKQRIKRTTSKGATTLLQSYIRQVTEAENNHLNKPINNNLHQRPYRVRYESSEGGFTSEEEEPAWHRHLPVANDDYVPVMLTSEEMATASAVEAGAVDYGVAMEKEMDLMEMIYRKAA